MWSDEICNYTEFDEITDGSTHKELVEQLKFQLNTLGYKTTDPFLRFLKELIDDKERRNES